MRLFSKFFFLIQLFQIQTLIQLLFQKNETKSKLCKKFALMNWTLDGSDFRVL